VTLPIPSTVFVDGQLVDEAGLYANVFTPINVLYAQLQTLTQANGLQRGSFSGTMPAAVSQTGTVTFPTAFGGTPNVTLGLMAGTGLLTAKMTTLSSTAFNWNIFYTNNVAGSNTFTVHWMAIG
jgi:hypothetical protein